MKKIKCVILVLFYIFILGACENVSNNFTNDSLDDEILGEWKYIDFMGEGDNLKPIILPNTYVKFNEDNTFLWFLDNDTQFTGVWEPRKSPYFEEDNIKVWNLIMDLEKDFPCFAGMHSDNSSLLFICIIDSSDPDNDLTFSFVKNGN